MSAANKNPAASWTLIRENVMACENGAKIHHSHVFAVDEMANAYPRLLAERAELVAVLRDLHAIDERKLAASEKRTYKIGHSAIQGRVERNRAILRKLGAE